MLRLFRNVLGNDRRNVRDKMQENMIDGICSTNNGGDNCMRNFTCFIRNLVYNVKEIYIYEVC